MPKTSSLLGFNFKRKPSDPVECSAVSRTPFTFSKELIENLSGGRTETRLSAVKEVTNKLSNHILTDKDLSTILVHTSDLMNPKQSDDTRLAVLNLYYRIIVTQYNNMGITRAQFFQIITTLTSKDGKSIEPMAIPLFGVLSQDGKDLHCFEREGPLFLDRVLGELVKSNEQIESFMEVLVNVVKHNAAFLDQDLINSICLHTCFHCIQTEHLGDAEHSLLLLDALVSYSPLPSCVLKTLIPTACRTVVVPELAQVSFQLIRKVMGTHLGYLSLVHLCRLVEDDENIADCNLIGGAVFFIGACLWSPKASIDADALSSKFFVMPLMALRRSASSTSVFVAREIITALLYLVDRRSGSTAMTVSRFHEWNLCFEIVKILFEKHPLMSSSPLTPLLLQLLAKLGTAYDENRLPDEGVEHLFQLIASNAAYCGEESLLRYVNYLASVVQPWHKGWLGHLEALLKRCYLGETRHARVRDAAAVIIRNVIENQLHLHEDELIDRIVLTYIRSFVAESDDELREKGVEFLLWMTTASPRLVDRCLQTIEEMVVDNKIPLLKSTILGIVDVIKKQTRFNVGSRVTAKCFAILGAYLRKSYALDRRHISDRRAVLTFLTSLRCNAYNQLGYAENGSVFFSPLLYVVKEPEKGVGGFDCSPAPSPVPSPATLSSSAATSTSCLGIRVVFESLTLALEQETDWDTYLMLVSNMKGMLENKRIVLFGAPVTQYCELLCERIRDRSFVEQANKTAASTDKRTLGQLQEVIYPVLSVFTIYKEELPMVVATSLISTFEVGMSTKCVQLCIRTLSFILCEMRDAMHKMLNGVLDTIAKLSATKTVSLAVLDFLSNLVRLPELYSSFVKDQYKTIFQIAVSYANSRRFNRYTVALAHRVIALWFLRCRIADRHSIADFILKRLNETEKQEADKSFEPIQRGRSGSLNERPLPSSGSVLGRSRMESGGHHTAPVDAPDLQTELIETCKDFLNFYKFASCAPQSKPSPTVDFLMRQGQSKHWIVGHKLLTVTTSGCSAGRTFSPDGLCDHCITVCGRLECLSGKGPGGAATASIPTPLSVPVDDDVISATLDTSCTTPRRRHCSADVHGVATSNLRHPKDSLLTRYDLQVAKTSHSAESLRASHPRDDLSNTVQSKFPGGVCNCWCRGWVQLRIRRPCGTTSWLTHIQNEMFASPMCKDSADTSTDIAKLFHYIVLDRSCSSEGLLTTPVSPLSRDESTNSLPTTDEDAASSGDVGIVRFAPCLKRTVSSPDADSSCSSTASGGKQTITRSASLNEGKGSSSNLQRRSPRKDDRYASIPEEPKNRRSPVVGSEASSSGGFRDRASTISVMSPASPQGSPLAPSITTKTYTLSGVPETARAGLNPTYVFHHLFPSAFTSDDSATPSVDRPIMLNDPLASAASRELPCVTSMDHILPYETHKIGLLYVDIDQHDETAILSNCFGSDRYWKFVLGLGTVVSLQDIDPQAIYAGGLDLDGSDGKFAVSWQDDVVQVMFHVATLMPSRKNDAQCAEKKKHIGNDCVTIVYNNGQRPYTPPPSSVFLQAAVIIEPLEDATNRVELRVTKNSLNDFVGEDLSLSAIVTDGTLPVYVKQVALHANLAATLSMHAAQYVNNWLERLRLLKRTRNRATETSNLKGLSSDDHFVP